MRVRAGSMGHLTYRVRGHAKSAEVGQLIISLLTTGSVLGMHLVIMI